jgi:hypothetical protein
VWPSLNSTLFFIFVIGIDTGITWQNFLTSLAEKFGRLGKKPDPFVILYFFGGIWTEVDNFFMFM